jgi:cellulose synthase/poly-beta-1,6-N-acetylglucosamine synthase-like glycosyltransferase
VTTDSRSPEQLPLGLGHSIARPSVPPEATVSIIIPLHRWTERSRYCLVRCIQLSERWSAEVIVVCDRHVEHFPDGARLLVTGASTDTSPAFKRDLAVTVARGTYLAFIDDDAYPDDSWIERSLDEMRGLNVDAVGGPGITPPESNWRERLSGLVYGSILGSGPLRHRFISQGASRLVSELPAYNFVVKRSCMETIGGWRSHFYGGEDTAVCSRLRSYGFRLAYVPDAVVYHYRRNAVIAHLKQIGNVGRHRGFFVRQRDSSSLHLLYFLPLFLTIASPLVLGAFILGSIYDLPMTLVALGAAWIGLALLVAREMRGRALIFPGLLLVHHLWYGVNFLIGTLSRSIDSHRDLNLNPRVMSPECSRDLP